MELFPLLCQNSMFPFLLSMLLFSLRYWVHSSGGRYLCLTKHELLLQRKDFPFAELVENRCFTNYLNSCDSWRDRLLFRYLGVVRYFFAFYRMITFVCVRIQTVTLSLNVLILC